MCVCMCVCVSVHVWEGFPLQPDVTIMDYKLPETQGCQPEGEGHF